MQQGEGNPIAILQAGSSSETALPMTVRMALDLGHESRRIAELFRNILPFADVDRHALVVSIRAREPWTAPPSFTPALASHST